MQIPRRIARFNRSVTNPIQGQWAWLLPPWAVVCHRGRRSGRPYRTPVLAFRSGLTLTIAILYGERSDWVQNVLAGADGGAGGGGGAGAGAVEGRDAPRVVRRGRTHALVSPRVLAPSQAPPVSRLGRMLGRFSGHLLVAELGAPEPGFGRGPSAS